MDIRSSRLPLAAAALLVLLFLSACSTVRDAVGGGDATPEVTATATDEPPVLARSFIGNTGGLGVSIRSDCATNARAGGAWAESTEVQILQRGEGRCEGWSLAAVNGATSWVSQRYLVTGQPGAASATLANAPTPSVTTTTPAPTTASTPRPSSPSTPTPAATTNPGAPVPPMSLYGPVNQQDTVGVLVNGQPCVTLGTIEEPASPTGYLWSTLLGAGQCGATNGSAITFTLNGAPTNEQLEWSPGGTPPDPATGISLTLR